MEEKMETLKPCSGCGDPRPIEAKISKGRYCVACRCCPTRSLGRTETEARKNWNEGVHH